MKYFVATLLALCPVGLCAQTVGDVLINEFCYDSNNNIGTSTGPDLEWVELYNATGAAIDLSNWEIRDNTGVAVIPSGNTIAPADYFIVSLTGNATIFLRYTGWPADFANTTTWSGLGNSGDGIAIFTSASAGSACIDFIQYATNTAVPGAPTYTGTRPPDLTGANDFSYGRVPNGLNGDATVGDPGSEQGATSFRAGPFTPGRANGGTVVDCYVPDQFSDHYTGGATIGAPIQTLVPRETANPERMIISLPPGYDFNTNSSFGFPNSIAIRSRYHDTAATVAVSYAINGAETTVSTSTMTLPSAGNMTVSNDLLATYGNIDGQLPTTLGTIVVDVTCAVSGGATQVFKLQIDIDAPQITTAPNLADILQAQTSPITLAATGGATPYSWSLAGNPAWAGVAAATGVLTMSPSAGVTGQFTFDVTVGDSNNPPRTHTLTFDVTVVEPLDIPTTTLTTIVEGASPADVVAATGGTAPYAYSLTGSPAWLGINAASGALTGTAPAGSAAVYNFTIDVSDAGNPVQTDSQAVSLAVVDVLTISSPASITNGIEASVYNYTFTAVGGTAPLVWTATGLPAFLGLNPNSGLLSGIPTNADSGTYNFDVTVTDTSAPAQTDLMAVTLIIDPLPTIPGSGGDGGGGDEGSGCTVTGPALAPAVLLALMGAAVWRRRKGGN